MGLRLPKGINLPKGITPYSGMKDLLEAGDVPLPAYEIMKLRVEKGDKFPALWIMNYNLSDLIIYPRGNLGGVYVFLTVDNKGQITEYGREALNLINSDDSKSIEDLVGILIDRGSEGLIEVSRRDITNAYLFEKESASNQKFLRVLARDPEEVPEGFEGSSELLKRYFGKVESKTRQPYNMAIDINYPSAVKKRLRSLCVGRSELLSRIYGKGIPDCEKVYLLGMAPEMYNTLDKIKD
ncbi:hypothetical protein KAI32_00055 [Candidatus Pacearchaeota archaeon]|nr:hypothetical protein [Candidatus Pacearchaeota archaeon]